VRGAPAKKRLGIGPRRRLRGSAAFETVLRSGRRSTRGGFVFYTLRREAGPPRLGILLSRRHAAKASVRNRIKRCIREAFRLEQEAIGAADVLVRPPYGMKPDGRLFARLRALFAELRP
jgi:ribonuclease P protein component